MLACQRMKILCSILFWRDTRGETQSLFWKKLRDVKNTFFSSPSDSWNYYHAMHTGAQFSIQIQILNTNTSFVSSLSPPLLHIINTYVLKFSLMLICHMYVYVCSRGNFLTAHLIVTRYVERFKNSFQDHR